MARLTVEIELDNDDFQSSQGNLSAYAIAAVLSQIAKRIGQGDRSGRAVDNNGNTVGSFAVEGD